jgi:hypothetical protein
LFTKAKRKISFLTDSAGSSTQGDRARALAVVGLMPQNNAVTTFLENPFPVDIQR